MKMILVLELYSGIGGMHLALNASGIQGEIVASIDINVTANNVYKHNFPGTKLLNRNIQSITSEWINDLNIDAIFMSPPCQPFTRNGLKADIKDARTSSFIHILNLLPTVNVHYILIENVKGFETSEMRNILVDTLRSCNFTFQEFLLSPSQFGIPNTRYRYYCLAKRDSENFTSKTSLLMDHIPGCETYLTCPFNISEILEEQEGINAENTFLISDNILKKHATTLDICYPNSNRSCCFTKSYGRYVNGTGSVFTYKSKEELNVVYKSLRNLENTDEYLRCINSLKLRFFTPREVCRLMCFPESFAFPNDVSNKQRYMLLGNSVNIKVVSLLIKFLIG